MTRINLVDPSELHYKHLTAEYRELPRIYELALQSIRPNIPDSYTLGTGYVRFFYNKLKWVIDRHIDLIHEMNHREYNPTFTIKDVHTMKRRIKEERPELFNDWSPNKDEIFTNRLRLFLRNPNTKDSP